jgi:hypothetical protein
MKINPLTVEKNGYKYEVILSNMTEEEEKFFKTANEEYSLTGFSLVITYPDGCGIVRETKPIFKGGRYTPYDMARVSKGKIVIACWDRYKTIDLKTGEVNTDADDVN